MNVSYRGGKDCDAARDHFDSYVSNELSVEKSHQILRHLECCPACAAEVETLARLRVRLRSAVVAEMVPPDLAPRIRQTVDLATRPRRGNFLWPGSLMAVAASVAVLFTLWTMAPSDLPLPSLDDHIGQRNFIQLVSSKVSAAFRIGLGDHIHCTVFRRAGGGRPSTPEMEAELGPTYRGLVSVVRNAAPRGYAIVDGHICHYLDRHFVHLVLMKGPRTASLIITPRLAGEALDGTRLSNLPSQLPLYSATADRFAMAAFQTPTLLAYLVSNLDSESHTQLVKALTPDVQRFLKDARI